jgi:uncharacterized membrane protein
MTVSQTNFWLGIAVVLAMASVTQATRLGGYLIMGRIEVTPRLDRALKALPGAIIISTIIPAALATGPIAFVGIGAAVTIMVACRSDFAALLGGLGSVIALRLFFS